jgi:hypothetical protein
LATASNSFAELYRPIVVINASGVLDLVLFLTLIELELRYVGLLE